jgi:hypothetical protein
MILGCLRTPHKIYNCVTFIQYKTCNICPGPVFQCGFDSGVYLVIRLTIFGSFSILQCVTSFNVGHVMVFRCEFNSGIYLVIRLTIFGSFSILQCVTSFNVGHVMVFQCEFNGGVHLVIRQTIFGNFSKCASYIRPGHIFQCEFSHDVYFGIRLPIFGNFFVLYVCICIIHYFSV